MASCCFVCSFIVCPIGSLSLSRAIYTAIFGSQKTIVRVTILHNPFRFSCWYPIKYFPADATAAYFYLHTHPHKKTIKKTVYSRTVKLWYEVLSPFLFFTPSKKKKKKTLRVGLTHFLPCADLCSCLQSVSYHIISIKKHPAADNYTTPCRHHINKILQVTPKTKDCTINNFLPSHWSPRAPPPLPTAPQKGTQQYTSKNRYTNSYRVKVSLSSSASVSSFPSSIDVSTYNYTLPKKDTKYDTKFMIWYPPP